MSLLTRRGHQLYAALLRMRDDRGGNALTRDL